MARLDEIFLGKARSAARFDPAQPEGVFKLCGCKQHVISWDRERCPSCDGRPVERAGRAEVMGNPPMPSPAPALWPLPVGGSNETRLEAPPPVSPVVRRNPTVIKDRTVIAPDLGGEVAITIRLRAGKRLEASPTVRLTVGEQVVMVVDGGEVSPQANDWWEVAVGHVAPSGRR